MGGRYGHVQGSDPERTASRSRHEAVMVIISDATERAAVRGCRTISRSRETSWSVSPSSTSRSSASSSPSSQSVDRPHVEREDLLVRRRARPALGEQLSCSFPGRAPMKRISTSRPGCFPRGGSCSRPGRRCAPARPCRARRSGRGRRSACLDYECGRFRDGQSGRSASSPRPSRSRARRARSGGGRAGSPTRSS